MVTKIYYRIIVNIAWCDSGIFPNQFMIHLVCLGLASKYLQREKIYVLVNTRLAKTIIEAD